MDASATFSWRSGVPQVSREKISQRLTSSLSKHRPPTGPEGVKELSEIACSFENKIFLSATDQEDYLRQISFKIFTLDTTAQLATDLPLEEWLVPRPDLDERPNGNSPSPKLCLPSQYGRQKVTQRIMSTLSKHMMPPPTDPGRLLELWKMACRLEEKTFFLAANEVEYLQQISLEVLSLETMAKATAAPAIEEGLEKLSLGPGTDDAGPSPI